jgi:hypothetical protein
MRIASLKGLASMILPTLFAQISIPRRIAGNAWHTITRSARPVEPTPAVTPTA